MMKVCLTSGSEIISFFVQSKGVKWYKQFTEKDPSLVVNIRKLVTAKIMKNNLRKILNRTSTTVNVVNLRSYNTS